MKYTIGFLSLGTGLLLLGCAGCSMMRAHRRKMMYRGKRMMRNVCKTVGGMCDAVHHMM